MNKVDWSLAPRWAEYVVVGPLSGFNYWANDNRRIQFCGDFDCCDDNHVKEGWDVVEEKPQSKPWSGPQDGLPPVGTVCEYSLGDSEYWYKCEVKYLLRDSEGLVAECYLQPSIEQYLSTYDGGSSVAKFRALKTPDQLASEQRETAIREFMDIVGTDCRVTASKAVDAGFKREVV